MWQAKWACDSAEQLGKQLRRRYQRQYAESALSLNAPFTKQAHKTQRLEGCSFGRR